MNHSQMLIIPQRCDYLMTTTFIGVVLLQPPKRKEEIKKSFILRERANFLLGRGGRRKQKKNGRFEC